jgi:hypothetical protein
VWNPNVHDRRFSSPPKMKNRHPLFPSSFFKTGKEFADADHRKPYFFRFPEDFNNITISFKRIGIKFLIVLLNSLFPCNVWANDLIIDYYTGYYIGQRRCSQ